MYTPSLFLATGCFFWSFPVAPKSIAKSTGTGWGVDLREATMRLAIGGRGGVGWDPRGETSTPLTPLVSFRMLEVDPGDV